MPFARLPEEWQPPTGNAILPVERMPFRWCYFQEMNNPMHQGK